MHANESTNPCDSVTACGAVIEAGHVISLFHAVSAKPVPFGRSEYGIRYVAWFPVATGPSAETTSAPMPPSPDGR